VLMMVYQAILGALATHVEGFELPPVYTYILTVIGPPLLLAANAMPFVLKGMPGQENSDVTLPPTPPKVILP
jgi:hypothetical protein